MDLFQLWGTVGIRTADAFKALEEVENKVNGAAEKMGTAMQNAGKSMQNVGQSISNTGASMTAGITGPIAAVGLAAGKLASDVQNSTGKIQSSLGMTKEEAKELSKVSQDLWKDGFGENLEQVDQALIQVKQNMQGIGNGDALKKATKDAMLLAQTYDADVNEVTRAANNLMKGFGVSSQDAFDMMAKGAQNGLNFSNEMFDNLAEYAPLWGQMGYSAEEMFGILERGSKAGVYNLDYVNDVMKEFQIRLKDGSKATSDAFDQLSPKSQEIWKKFNEGKATVSDVASTVVGELKAMDDQVLANQIGVGLFGTKWEDLESDAMYAMLGTTGAMKDFKGSMDDVADATEETFGMKWQKFLRTAQHALLPVGEILLDVANEWLPKIAKAVEWVANAFAGLPKGMQGTIVAGGVLLALLGPLLMIFGAITTGIGGVVAAFGTLTKGVGGLASKLVGMPGLIGKMFKAFGGAKGAASAVDSVTDALDGANNNNGGNGGKGGKGGAVPVGGCNCGGSCGGGCDKDKDKNKGKNSRTPAPAPVPAGGGRNNNAPTPPTPDAGGRNNRSKNPFAKLPGMAKNAAKGIGKAFGGIGKVIARVGAMFLPLLANPMALAVAAVVAIVAGLVVLLVKNWDAIKAGAIKAFTAIGDFFTSIWEGIKTAFSAALGFIKNLVTTIFNGIKSFITMVMTGIQTVISTIWNGIKTVVTTVLNGIKMVVTTVFNFIKSFITTIMNGIQMVISMIWNTIKTIFTTVLNAIKMVVTTVFNAIKSFISTVMNAIKTIISTIWNAIKTIISTVLNTIKNIVSTVWNAIKNFISTVLNTIKNIVSTVWNAIKSFISTVMGAIKNIISTAWNAIKNIVSSAINFVKNKVTAVFNAIKNAAVSLGNGIKNALSSAFNFIKNAASNAVNWGKDIIRGLGKGISSMVGWVVDKVKGVARGIAKAVKSFFGIHSPSRLMAGFGVNIGQGLGQGIESTTKLVGKASDALNNMVKPPDAMDVPITPNVSRIDPTTALRANGVVPGGVTNNNTTNDRGVTIQNASFEIKVEKVQTAEDIAKLRKTIQDVVSDDLFGMAVRNV